MAATTLENLTELTPLLEVNPGFDELIAALEAGNSGTFDGAWGSASALAAASLLKRSTGTVLVVLPRASDLDDYVDDLTAFTGVMPEVFPAWDTLPDEHSVADSVFGRRLRVVRRMQSESPPPLVLATMTALLQPVPSRGRRRPSSCAERPWGDRT